MTDRTNDRSGRTAAAMVAAVVLAGLAAGAATAAPAAGKKAAGGAFEPAFGLGEVDLKLSRQVRRNKAEGEKVSAVDIEALRQALGFGAGKAWRMPNAKGMTTYQYLIVLKKPVSVGAMHASAAANYSSNKGEVYYLRPDVSGAPDPDKKDQWVQVKFEARQLGPRFFTFPPGVKIRAFLYEDKRGWSYSQLSQWRFFKRRIFNATPRAIGIAETLPWGWGPNAIPMGHVWKNTGADMETGRIPRPPISSVHPSWYILSWEQDLDVVGVILRSSATEYHLYSYRGNPEENPGVAHRLDWEKIRPDSSNNGWLSLPPTKTRAVKMGITRAGRNSPIVNINAFHVLADLKDAPVPKLPDAPAPAFTVRYDQPFDGEVAMVIEGPDGTRVQNLVAQVSRKKGPNAETWDLRDQIGNRMMPGRYRWKGITAPPFTLRYQVSPYPNVETFWDDRLPWDRGTENCWMADHTMATSGTAAGDRIYFGAPGAEGGTAFIELDKNGKKTRSIGGTQYWLAGDDKYVYRDHHGSVSRMEVATRKGAGRFSYHTPTRPGWISGMAVKKGKVYLSFTSPRNYIFNATSGGNIDFKASLPYHTRRVLEGGGETRVQPNPQADFVRVLRMGRTPPGQLPPKDKQPNLVFPCYLDSTFGASRHQYVVVAFKKPTRIGSLAFPYPDGNAVKLHFSVLKPDAPFPPRPRKDDDWIAFEEQGRPGWECIPAPPETMTRALRIRFTGRGDELDDIDEEMEEEGEEDAALIPMDRKGLPDARGSVADRKRAGRWFGRLEGLKILGRRFKSLHHTAKVRVSSGKANKLGEWASDRKRVISVNRPANYVMEWDEAQKITGLAIREVDVARTEIDVWVGDGEVKVDGMEGWKHVATYRQEQRSGAQPSFYRNVHARYMDGYVDFHKEIKTRAIRLRSVAQWLRSRGPYRPDLAMRPDTRRCRVWGVAPLQDLDAGTESDVDDVWYQRLAIYDAETKKLVHEVREDVGHRLTICPKTGQLYALKDAKVVKVDEKTGKTTPIITDLENPTCMDIGPKGNFYVFNWRPTRVIRKYDPNGKFLHLIGKPGGYKDGWWDPQRFGWVSTIFVAQEDNLWVVESQDIPRRMMHYKTDGTYVKEMLGNAHYGGAGVLDRYDKKWSYYSNVMFETDWKTRKSQIKSLLAPKIHATTDLVPLRMNGRKYLCSAPQLMQGGESYKTVYIFDEKTGRARLAAAFGAGGSFDPLQAPEILEKLDGKVPADFEFLWSDLNGDGEVNVEEVEFTPASGGNWLGRFDKKMGCSGSGKRWEVAKFLPNGAPVFKKRILKHAGLYRLNNGNYFRMAQPTGHGEGMENQVYSPDGKKVWGYPVSHPGVSGLYVPPWIPGYVTNEFGIIGHETADKGDLGEFFVIHSNTGSWRLWTADGLLAGQVAVHRSNPEARYLGPASNKMGIDVGRLTAGQEHFHGFFTKTEADGKYYISIGGHWISFVEVIGIDKYKRMGGDVVITPEDFRRVLKWEGERTRKQVRSRAPVLRCGRMAEPPRLDARVGATEWPEKGATLGGPGKGLELITGYDDRYLYLCWKGAGVGPVKNTGEDFRRLFKTGGALDLFLSTDPKANPGRRHPAAGDVRLLMTWVNGRPKAVLYRPVAPGAGKDEAWSATTVAGGTTAFEQVNVLDRARMVVSGDASFVAEMAIPLQDLGLKIKDEMRLKIDWGILTTREGRRTYERLYWTNSMANGTTDEAIEARLEPHLWGYVRFSKHAVDADAPARRAKGMMDGADETDDEEIMKELEGD